jgi:nucleoporin-like protein 2
MSKLQIFTQIFCRRAIEEEIRLIQGGKQWPFSCMCPLKESGNIPGYDDVSAEELRFEAYEAQSQNNFEVYVVGILSWVFWH